MMLAIIRILFFLLLPLSTAAYMIKITAFRVIVKGKPKSSRPSSSSLSSTGVLYVCNHRTFFDPVFIASTLNRRIAAVTYSLSSIWEPFAPIPTIRLSRNRNTDEDKIKQELAKGDLIICPEGTTCRETFLLRFSSLFAELTDQIVPVAVNFQASLFYATTARGWKVWDPIFFAMNPTLVYEFTFLDKLPIETTCSHGKTAIDVANYVQRLLAATLKFECTNFTKKDKYRLLAGNDGTVAH